MVGEEQRLDLPKANTGVHEPVDGLRPTVDQHVVVVDADDDARATAFRYRDGTASTDEGGFHEW